MKKDFKYWLRWIAVLPGAILAGLLATFVLHWVLYSTLRNEAIFIDPYPELPERILSAFTIALGFVWLGARIAPDNKGKAATSLLVIYIIFWAASNLTTLVNYGATVTFQYGGVPTILALAGAILGFYLTKREAKRKA
ncbi:MAG: hypothetical protein A3B30_00070 [Candidatus Komeilibacteria bacterium RIFCSPLOWO2_01_FULL_52_15]|uniref:Uncharacterized protein n=1 Tax=Candidatus Komeilibacteria bacterium RIFCSPLOWO2_01_FULL_52_15 TaxID=1798551 RepID=A0A1G2BPW0_9BACT|nr:MAG: hypothetical protein A3B30_00070 [Candidatus Komeilibacteria bacterium RIFCSPLOWO2_01_FULL_52_15]